MELDIVLDTIDKIKGFVSTVSKYSSSFDLADGRHVVDAKSILGVIDTSVKPLALAMGI